MQCRASLASRAACSQQLAPRLRCATVPRAAGSTQSAVTDADRAYILHALELAKRAQGKTHPNPAVGCVIVKDGKVVGEGYHPRAGMPHAEVYALRAAGNQAVGATAYVTLEPCNHHGRTPPCSRALVDAKVARVVVGVGDPNPLVASEGLATLARAGVSVTVMDGPERDACYGLNKDFMERMIMEAAKAASAAASAAEAEAAKAAAAAKAATEAAAGGKEGGKEGGKAEAK